MSLLLAIARDRRRSAWGRVQAIRELLNRGWGSAPLSITVTHQKEDNLLRFATDEELRQFDELHDRLEARKQAAAASNT